jgi:hypothetical protein
MPLEAEREARMRKAIVPVLTLVLFLVLAMAPWAQQAGKPLEKKPPVPPTKPAPQMTPEQKAAMEKMEKAATPGPEHKFLASFTGTWKAEVKTWENASAQPQVSQGTGEDKMILGGRFLHSTFKSSFMGQPFEGMGLTGFDNVLKKFQGVWIDSMGTAMMTAVGELDKTGTVLTCTDTYTDPQTGKVETMRDVMKLVDKDKKIDQMYAKGKDGKEFLMMEITYTRVPALKK